MQRNRCSTSAEYAPLRDRRSGGPVVPDRKSRVTRVWSVGLTRTHGDDMANVLHVNVWSNALTRGVVRWPTLDTAAYTGNPLGSHETSDALLGDAHLPLGQFHVNSGSSIRPAALEVDRPDLPGQHAVAQHARRRTSLRPRVVAAGGDAQDPTHRRYGILGPVRAHELESLDGIDPVSRANQAAAFDNISRSSRNCRFSRRSRRSSSRSADVSPSERDPLSRSA